MVIFTGMKAESTPRLAPKPKYRNRTSQVRSPVRTKHRSTKSSRYRRRLLVVKFGGSSLSNAAQISQAARSVAKECSRGNKVVAVVSAIGKTTDQLLQLTNQGQSVVQTDTDDILAMGERTSVRIFAASLRSHGIQARYFDPSDKDWPIITDDQFTNANPDEKTSFQRIVRYVKPLLTDGVVPVVGGFIGKTRDGRISTLGRGGSDTTAMLLATALGADEIVLVTNVPGILTGNPTVIRTTQVIPEIDIRGLVGIADAGTKFIHRKALRFKDPRIDIRVVSNAAGRLDTGGTLITGGPLPELDVIVHNPHPVASVTMVGNDLPRRPELMREITEAAGSNIVAVSQDGHSSILYLKQTTGLEKLVQKLHDIVVKDSAGLAVAARTGMALIDIKGVGLEDTPGVIGKISDALRSKAINVFGILTITSSVLVLVDWRMRRRAAGLIRDSFGELE